MHPETGPDPPDKVQPPAPAEDRTVAESAWAEPAHTRAAWPSAFGSEPPTERDLDGLGRYVVQELIGSGGMGRVYKAWDPSLRRPVALKLLQFERPEFLARFRLEAQSQARISHPNVLKVYEVGEWRGQPYLALQFVDGRSLAGALQDLSLEVKVDVLAQVADGLHAAHRLGIVHRDVKPSNVLLERVEGGGWHAYVCDFGLAREDQGEGLTRTGMEMGTPGFMAPEQIRGERARVGKASDIYSLGATLFHCLTGAFPYRGEGAVELMAAALRDEPRSLRSVTPDLPRELEVIASVCLERDPARRYPSARAVAEDLRRFLDGEPIVMRGLTRLQRLRRLARRNRAATLALAAAAGVALLSAGLVARTWLDRRQSLQLAGRWAAEVAEIETGARQVRLMPTRDIRADLVRARDRLAALEAEVARAGPTARTTGRAILGRGHLALRDWARARAHLDAAYADGLRSPELLQARGETYGRLFVEGRAQAVRLDEPGERARRIGELDRSLRIPALAMLRESGAGSLVAARIAFLDGRHAEAIQLAGKVVEAAPWHYEALLLQGESALAQAAGCEDFRQYEVGLQRFTEADRLIRAALEIGRSDPEGWLLLARRYEQEEAHRAKKGGRSLEMQARAEAALAQVRRIDPENPVILALEARLLVHRIDTLTSEGADPESIAPDIEARLSYLAQRPGSPASVATELADVRLGWGRERARRLRDPLELYRGAVDACALAAAREPLDERTRTWAGLAHLWSGVWLRFSGEDPGAQARHFEAAATAFAPRERERLPDNAAWVQMERMHLDLLAGRDPEPAYAAGEACYEQVFQHQIRDHYVLFVRAQAAAAMARWRMVQGRDPAELVARARKLADQANLLRTRSPDVRITLAQVAAAEAELAHRQGRDPRPALARADRDLREDPRNRDLPMLTFQAAQINALRARLTGDRAARRRALLQLIPLARRFPRGEPARALAELGGS